MRRSPVLVTALIVVLGLLMGPAGARQTPAPAAKPASYAFLKAQVFTAPGLGQVAVGMPNERTVKVQHRTDGGVWSSPTTLFRKKGITCGEINGRASAGGVVLLVECDTPYYEDQAPVRSMGFVTQDLVTWSGKRLDGEAHQDPAISADGSHAAWLFGAHGQFQLFSEGSGFTTGTTSFDYDSGGETVVVDDVGTVTVIGPDSVDGKCALGVYDQPLAGPEDAYVIPGVDPGCTEGGVDNVDDRTVIGAWTREYRFRVTREPGERWVLTQGPPIDDPSLVRYRGPTRQVIRNVFADAAGQALVSIGSTDRKQVYAQSYDDESGSWGTTQLVYDHTKPGRCQARQYYPYEPRPRLHAVQLRCAGKVVLLTSPDSTTWTTTVLADRPYGLSGNGSLLAAPGPRSTTLVSPAGTARVPVTADGPCDFVFPIAPDAVVRLHGGKNARWPTRLQMSQPGGSWRTIQQVKMPATSSCQQIQAQHDEPPTLFFLRGGGRYVSLVVRRGGQGGWHVERFQY